VPALDPPPDVATGPPDVAGAGTVPSSTAAADPQPVHAAAIRHPRITPRISHLRFDGPMVPVERNSPLTVT
jgi:hypothetical protein